MRTHARVAFAFARLELLRAARALAPLVVAMAGAVVVVCAGIGLLGLQGHRIEVEVADPSAYARFETWERERLEARLAQVERREDVEREHVPRARLVRAASAQADAVIRPPADPVREPWSVEVRDLGAAEAAEAQAAALQEALRQDEALGPVAREVVEAPERDLPALPRGFWILVVAALAVPAVLTFHPKSGRPLDLASCVPRRTIAALEIARDAAFPWVMPLIGVAAALLAAGRTEGAGLAAAMASCSLVGAAGARVWVAWREAGHEVPAVAALGALAGAPIALLLAPDAAWPALACVPGLGLVAGSAPAASWAWLGVTQTAGALGVWAAASAVVAEPDRFRPPRVRSR